MPRRNPKYGATHDAEREKWAPIVATGTVECRRGREGCKRAPQLVIRPDEPWDLGHPDAACDAPTAPEHRGCNRSTATHYAQAARRPAEVHPAVHDLLARS